jgi:phosphoglucomutase
VLTGFKYIGRIVHDLLQTHEGDFVLGFEESAGYLIGTHIQDKDAIVAAQVVAMMAARASAAGTTLVNALSDIYAEFGRYYHQTITIDYSGAQGAQGLQAVMHALRTQRPDNFVYGTHEYAIVNTIDYLHDYTGLPLSDVIQFELGKGCRAIIRPSGTEPLIKVYLTTMSVLDINCLSSAIKKHLNA